MFVIVVRDLRRRRLSPSLQIKSVIVAVRDVRLLPLTIPLSSSVSSFVRVSLSLSLFDFVSPSCSSVSFLPPGKKRKEGVARRILRVRRLFRGRTHARARCSRTNKANVEQDRRAGEGLGGRRRWLSHCTDNSWCQLEALIGNSYRGCKRVSKSVGKTVLRLRASVQTRETNATSACPFLIIAICNRSRYRSRVDFTRSRRLAASLRWNELNYAIGLCDPQERTIRSKARKARIRLESGGVRGEGGGRGPVVSFHHAIMYTTIDERTTINDSSSLPPRKMHRKLLVGRSRVREMLTLSNLHSSLGICLSNL